MSRVRARRLTDKVTVWIKGNYSAANPYSDGYTLLGTYQCNWIEGGSVARDAEGSEFTPNKTIRLWGVGLDYGDKVWIGESLSDTPPKDAEIVRGKKGGTTLIGNSDFTVYTG